MKKLTLTVILLLVAIIGVLGLTACGGEGGPGYQPPRPQTLRVNAPTTVYQGATDGYKIEIITVMTDGSESRTETGTYSLSSEDQSKFNTVGTHTITVSFNGLTTTYQIEVIPSYEGPDGLRFTVSGQSATLVGYSNSDPVPETITLPTEYCGLPVTSTESAIFSNASIKKIIIPEGYTTIGANFCMYANSLEEVVIPKSVTTIGEKAFYCESYVTPVLTKVTYNGTLEDWLGIRFANASACPTYRGATLYINEEALTELVIPETVAFIPNYAFYGNVGLVSLTATNKTDFYTESFYKCTNLETVTATAAQLISVERAGIKTLTVIASRDGATDSEKTLTRVRDGSYNNAFAALETVVIHDGIVGACCFYGCETLKTVVLGDGVTEIQEEAFYECTALHDVTIGKGVVKMGRYAFAETYSLNKVMIYDIAGWCTMEMESAMSFTSSGYVDGVYRNNFADLYLYDEEDEEFLKVKYLKIPETVTEISPKAFANCTTIIGVKFNEGLEKIGQEAFYGCRNLVYVDLSSTITEIGENAFSYCDKLYEVINRSEEIEIVAGDSQNGNLGGYAPLIKNDPDASTSLTNRAGYIVHIRSGSGSVVNNINGYWETLVSCYADGDTVYIDNADIDYIAPYAFYGLKNLKYLTLECPLLEKIGTGAFSGCDIETFCFRDYSMINATEAEMRTSLLNKWARIEVISNPLSGARFYVNEIEVTEITPEDITVSTIKEGVFSGWLGTSVHLSDSVVTIEKYAFQNCPNITYFNSGNGLRNIYDAAFRYCSELNTVVLGESASNVWSSAFDADYALVEIYSLNPSFNVGSLVHWMKRDKGLPIVYTDLNAERLVSVDDDGYVIATVGNEKWFVDYRGNSNEIIIPDGVTHIAMEIFDGNKDITKLVVPDSVKYIGKYAFGFCSNLSDVTLGSGIERIGNCALEGLPDSVYEWEKEEGINHVKYIGAYAIRGYYLHNDVTIREGTRVIADGFKDLGSDMRNVTNIYLPEGLITIGESAFSDYYYGNEGVRELTIPSTVTYIGSSAFNGARLTSLTLLNTDAYIGADAFGNVDFLAVDGATVIGNTFMHINSEVTGAYTVADGIKTIQTYAFSDSQLTEVIISDSVEYIYENVFNRCSNLEKLTIGAGVKYIGAELFGGGEISDFPEIHYNGTMEEWGALEKSPIWVIFSQYAGDVYVHCDDGDVKIH